MRSTAVSADTRERCLILCRVSSKGQRDKDTIASQHRDLPVIAEAHNLRVVATLDDNGISGTIADRPALQKALAMAERREYDVLLVRDLKRIMRSDDLEAAKVYDKLRKLKIKVLTQHQMFDPANPNDNFMFSIHRGLSAFDREMLLETMRSGRRTHVARAGRIGRDPYGYAWQPNASKKGGGEYVIVEAEAKIVRKVFTTALTTGVSQIAYDLNTRNVPTRPVLRNTKDDEGNIVRPRVATMWDPASVGRLLRSPMYKGERHVKLAGEAPVVQAVPAIVSAADWDRVQVAISKRQSTKRTKRNYEHLCRNLVQCGECGYRMTAANPQTPPTSGKTGRTKCYYRCGTVNWKKMKRPHRCAMGYVRTDAVDTAVWDAITTALSDSALLTAALRVIKEQPTQDWAAMVAEVERELASIDAQEDRVLRWLRAGHNTEKLDAEMIDIQHRRKDASERLDLAKRGLADTRKNSDVDAAIRAAADGFKVQAKTARFARKRELLLQLMTRKTDRIELHRDGTIRIYGSVMLLGMARPFEAVTQIR